MTEALRITRIGIEHTASETTGLAVSRQPSDDLLELRLKYVESMGWLEPGRQSDADRYDDNLDTVHISHRSDSGEVVAGMRLTPVDDFEESISFREMIGSDEDYRRSVQTNLEAMLDQQPDVQMWDLTRLVHDTSREGRGQVVGAFLEIFGAGLAATSLEWDKDPYWVFITTKQIKTMLSRCGIEVHDIGQQTELDDETKSYCCLVKPVEAMAKLSDDSSRSMTYRRLQSGFDKVVGIE